MTVMLQSLKDFLGSTWSPNMVRQEAALKALINGVKGDNAGLSRLMWKLDKNLNSESIFLLGWWKNQIFLDFQVNRIRTIAKGTWLGPR